MPATVDIKLMPRHAGQQRVMAEAERFNVLACGRRFGKTTLGLDLAIDGPLLQGAPVGWFTPTYKMLLEVWREASRLLGDMAVKVNASERRIELVTGGVFEFWSLTDADVARGREYGRIIVDEAAMVKGLLASWNAVLRPTLADRQGDAWFLSTPKGMTDYHELFKRGQSVKHGDWASWQMPTWTNPTIPQGEIEAMKRDMPPRVYQQEVEGKFIADAEGALWRQDTIERYRVDEAPTLTRIIVGVDPAGGGPDEVGIVTVGKGADGHFYVLDDGSMRGSPHAWAQRVVGSYHKHEADMIVAEKNYGGDMVQSTIQGADARAPVRLVTASRGKQLRAEPISYRYEQGEVHHVGYHSTLEAQMTQWDPSERGKSPDRLDALVFALTELAPSSGHRSGRTASLPM